MKLEIIEALGLELTKARIANKNPLDFDITSAELWVNTYKESCAEVESELNKDRKRHAPSTGGSRTF